MKGPARDRDLVNSDVVFDELAASQDAKAWSPRIVIGKDNEPPTEVAALKNGTFVVIWTSPEGTNDAPNSIRFQIYHADGSPKTTVQTIPAAGAGAGNRFSPTVVGLSDGRFAVAWAQTKVVTNEETGELTSLYTSVAGAIYGADGTLSRAPSFLNEGSKVLGTTISYTYPELTALDNGGFALSTVQSRLSSSSGQITTSTNTTLYSSTFVGSAAATILNNYNASAVMADLPVGWNGTAEKVYVAVYAKPSSGSDTSNATVWFEIRSKATNGFNTNNVVANVPADLVKGEGKISVSTVGDKFIIATPTGDGQINVKMFRAVDGSRTDFNLDLSIKGAAAKPTIAGLADNNTFALAWIEDNLVWTVVYDQVGIQIARPTALNAGDVTGTINHVYIDTLADGRFAVSYDYTATAGGVRARSYLQIYDTRIHETATSGIARDLSTAFKDIEYTGTFSHDSLDGGDGADTLYGADGNDTLIGGDGNDSGLPHAGDPGVILVQRWSGRQLGSRDQDLWCRRSVAQR